MVRLRRGEPARRPARRRRRAPAPSSRSCARMSPATTCASSTPRRWRAPASRTSGCTCPERAMTTWIALDVSPSMAFGTAQRLKSDVAGGIALVLARLAVRRAGSVGVVAFGAPAPILLPPRGVASRARRGPRADRGRRRARRAGATAAALAAALERIAPLARRTGLVAIVSDFRGQAGWSGPLAALRGRHTVVAFDVSDPRETDTPGGRAARAGRPRERRAPGGRHVLAARAPALRGARARAPRRARGRAATPARAAPAPRHAAAIGCSTSRAGSRPLACGSAGELLRAGVAVRAAGGARRAAGAAPRAPAPAAATRCASRRSRSLRAAAAAEATLAAAHPRRGAAARPCGARRSRWRAPMSPRPSRCARARSCWCSTIPARWPRPT